MKKSTTAVSGGESRAARFERSTHVAVVPGVSFGHDDLDEWREVALGRRPGAANLGCVGTVVGPPAVASHVECSQEERRLAGIPEGLVRYSARIEDVEDLVADLERALGELS